MHISTLLPAFFAACASTAPTDTSSNAAAATKIHHKPPHKPTSAASPGPYSGGGLIISNRHLESVCAPMNSTHKPDLSFPCNIASLVIFECTYGAENGTLAFQQLTSPTPDLEELKHYTPQSNRIQRIYACSSQFSDEINGCAVCEKAHGGQDALAFFSENNITASMSSAYCALSATPSVGLLEYVQDWTIGKSMPASVRSKVSAAETERYHDPLRTSTEVGIYWTGSVTGSEAWSIVDATDSVAVVTESGRIVSAVAKGSVVGAQTSVSMSTRGVAAVGTLGVAAVMAMI